MSNARAAREARFRCRLKPLGRAKIGKHPSPSRAAPFCVDVTRVCNPWSCVPARELVRRVRRSTGSENPCHENASRDSLHPTLRTPPRRRAKVVPTLQAQPQPPPLRLPPPRPHHPPGRGEGEDDRGEPERKLGLNLEVVSPRALLKTQRNSLRALQTCADGKVVPVERSVHGVGQIEEQAATIRGEFKREITALSR